MTMWNTSARVVHTQGLSAWPLLQAGDLGDAVIAVLCADGTRPDVLKTILARIVEAPAEERAAPLAQLLILSELRGIRSVIEREWQAMAVTVNIENIPLLREPIDRARAEGRAEGRTEGRTEGMAKAIQRLLERRFPGQVPDGLTEHLIQLGPEVIDEVGTNLLTGETIEEVLGPHMPGMGPGSAS